MVPTVLIDVCLNVALGASVVLAGHQAQEEGPAWRAPGLWSLVAFQVFVWVPVGAYLLWRFPGWSLMYLVDETLPPPPLPALAALYPIAGLAGYFGAKALLSRLGFRGPAALFAVGLLVSLAITWFGREQLLVVGTTAEYRAATPMRSVFASPLPYFLGVAGPAVVVVWGMTLWRLSLLRRNRKQAAKQHSGPPVKGGDTMQLQSSDMVDDASARKRRKKS